MKEELSKVEITISHDSLYHLGITAVITVVTCVLILSILKKVSR